MLRRSLLTFCRLLDKPHIRLVGHSTLKTFIAKVYSRSDEEGLQLIARWRYQDQALGHGKKHSARVVRFLGYRLNFSHQTI